ncbi:MAG: hypothetical protein HRU09_12250 [Oligoflexales bacterium]|nr:hypothetical protein [Oligoflexales bacterium]
MVDISRKTIHFETPIINFFSHIYFCLGRESSEPISHSDSEKLEELDKKCILALKEYFHQQDHDNFSVNFDPCLISLYLEKIKLSYREISDDVANLKIDDYCILHDVFDVLRFFSALAWIKFDSRKLFNGSGNGVGSSILIFKMDDLIDLICSHSPQYSLVKTRHLVEKLTFNPNDFKSDCRIQPLIDIGNSNILMIPQALIHNDFARNALSNLQRLNPSSYNKFSSQKEARQVKKMFEKISSCNNIYCMTRINLPNKLPDIDLLLLDEKNSCICFFEIKSLLEPISISQIKSKQEEIDKGQSQLKDIKHYIDNNWSTFAKKYNIPSIEIGRNYEKRFAIISDNFVGNANISQPFPVITFEWLACCLSIEGNLSRSLKIIEKSNLLPITEQDLEKVTDTIEFAGFTFNIRQYSLRKESIFYPYKDK